MDEQSARAWLDALANAWRAQDADAMAALFTEDATDQVDPFQPPVSGRENLRKGFAWWMRGQRDIRMTVDNVDVIGNRFYALVDASWFVVPNGEQMRERGLLVCDMEGDKARVMREFWKTLKG
jgi:uncharacterized protein (TIGR02246 family)